MKTALLEDDIELISGQHLDASVLSEDQANRVPYLTGPTDFECGKPAPRRFTAEGRAFCETGDLLIVVKGSGTGAVFRADGYYSIGRQLMAIRPKSWETGFIHQVLLANTKRYNSLASGLIPGISRDVILQTPLRSTNLPEQRRIAEILGAWDRAIETQQKLITAKTARLRTLRHQLLTGSRRFPEFQGKWKKVRLSDLLVEHERHVAWDDADTYDLVSVRRRSGGVFFRESLRGSDIKTKVMKTIAAGDFVIARMQAVHGAIAVVPPEHDGKHVSDSYNTLQPRNGAELDIHFFGWLSTLPQFYRLILISSHGVVIEKMTFDLSDFLKRSVVIPPSKAEQTRISTVLNAARREIDLLTTQLESLKQQKRGLMQKLLTGEVRVQSTPADPNSE